MFERLRMSGVRRRAGGGRVARIEGRANGKRQLHAAYAAAASRPADERHTWLRFQTSGLTVRDQWDLWESGGPFVV